MVRPRSRTFPVVLRGSHRRRSITWGILLQYFVEFGCSYIDGVASFRMAAVALFPLGKRIVDADPPRDWMHAGSTVVRQDAIAR